jgi:C4-dicarboxylate-specific signal transduction histidine kinase
MTDDATQVAWLSQLAAGLAHDLNNVLGGVNNIAGAALMDAQSPPDGTLADDLRQIVRTSREGLAVAARLAVLGRSRSPKRMEVDARAALAQAIRAVQAPEGAVFLECPPALSLQADAKLLHEALCALLQNALDATEGGGPVWARATREGQHIFFSICDRAGPLPEHLGPLWAPYTTTKSGGRGRGLGLTLAWAVAVGHGGALRLGAEAGETRAVLQVPV